MLITFWCKCGNKEDVEIKDNNHYADSKGFSINAGTNDDILIKCKKCGYEAQLYNIGGY